MPEFPFLVICKPADGSNPDSLKCTAMHDGTHLGRIPRGFICRAKREYMGKYELAVYQTPWPWQPIGWGSVYADKDYLPEYVPGDPEPAPVGDKFHAALIAMAKEFVRVMEIR